MHPTFRPGALVPTAALAYKAPRRSGGPNPSRSSFSSLRPLALARIRHSLLQSLGTCPTGLPLCPPRLSWAGPPPPRLPGPTAQDVHQGHCDMSAHWPCPLGVLPQGPGRGLGERGCLFYFRVASATSHHWRSSRRPRWPICGKTSQGQTRTVSQEKAASRHVPRASPGRASGLGGVSILQGGGGMPSRATRTDPAPHRGRSWSSRSEQDPRQHRVLLHLVPTGI